MLIRIIGFCVGSLLVAGMLLLLLGTPDFHRGAEEADQARIDAAIENLRRKWDERAPAPADDAVVATGERSASPAREPPGVAVPEAGSPDNPPSGAMPAIADGNAAQELSAAAGPNEPEWHAIWTPFRTEIAARGFVSRLENVTSLDYRVAKLGSGAYQAAFAYRDPAERDAGLAQIAAATGLDLSSDLP